MLYFKCFSKKCVVVNRWLHRLKRHFFLFHLSIYFFPSLSLLLGARENKALTRVRAWKYRSIRHLMNNNIQFDIKDERCIIVQHRHFLRIIQFECVKRTLTSGFLCFNCRLIESKTEKITATEWRVKTKPKKTACDSKQRELRFDFIHAYAEQNCARERERVERKMNE